MTDDSTFQELFLSNDSNDQSCFNISRTMWYYNGSSISPQSSLIIVAGSLLSNRTYRFRVTMINLYNSSIKVVGTLLVNVVEINSYFIAVG